MWYYELILKYTKNELNILLQLQKILPSLDVLEQVYIIILHPSSAFHTRVIYSVALHHHFVDFFSSYIFWNNVSKWSCDSIYYLCSCSGETLDGLIFPFESHRVLCARVDLLLVCVVNQ